MIRPKPDIPERVPVLSFPSPAGQADLLFYEVRDGHLPKNKEWAYGDPHPDRAAFPNHELVYVAPEGGAGWQRWFYAARRQDQHLYNWQFSNEREWPLIVQTFIVKRGDFSVTETFEPPPLEFFPYPQEWAVTAVEERPLNDETLSSTFVTVSVTREQVLKRTVIGTTTLTSSVGSSTATVSSSFSLIAVGDYIEAQCYPSIGAKVDGVTAPSTVSLAQSATEGGTFSATITRYVENELVGREFDPDTNSSTPYRRIKVPSTTTVPSGIQPNGSVIELQPVNTMWSIKNTKQASGLAGSAINGKATRTFQIVTNWAWPAVLDYVKITPVYADNSDIYSAVTGYITAPMFAVDAYSGPCLATIIEEWTSKLPVVGGDPTWDSTKLTSPQLPEPTPLLPKAISFRSSLLDVVVPECLHDYITFYAANFQQEYPATNYTRWPGSVVAEVDLRPHQGGWLKRVMIVNCPSQAGVAPELYLQVSATFATSFQLNWTNLAGTTALKLDVSSDPSFKTGFLPGFKDLSVLGLTTKLVTGASRGVPYYCRITVTRPTGVTQSNIVAVMCPPQPEIALYVPGPDGLSNTADDVELPAVTGTLAFGDAQTTTGVTKTVIIRNAGLLSLSGLAISFTGAAYTSYFSVVGSLPEAIAPGGYAVVNVRMLPTAAIGALSVGMVVTSNAVNFPSYAVTLTGTAVQPEVDVLYSGTSRPSGDTVALGNVNTGSTGTFTFTIQNTGNGALTAVVSVTDPNSPSPWTLLDAPDEPIPAGGSASFVVSFAPTEAGAKTLSVSIDNNDPTGAEDPYLLTLSATGVAVGRIDVVSPSPSSVDMGPGDSYYFGFSDTAVLKTAIFTIVNKGVGTLNSLAAALSGADAAQFSLGGLATSIAAGDSTTLTVGFTPTTTGLKNAVLTLTSSDPDQPSYAINLSGTGGIEHEIQVESPAGTVLVDAVSRSSYGSMLTGTSRTNRFWIRNVGNAKLTSLAASVTGGDAAKFFVSALTPVTTDLEAGESAYFDVTLTPGTTVGPLSTTLSIASNDHDENPFTVALFGFAYASGSISTFQPSSLILGQSSAAADVNSLTQAGLSSSLASRPAVSLSGRVAIADTASNRVLIWNSYPALYTGQPADVVIGQPNFTSSTSTGITASNLVAPKAVAWYGEKLLVGDTGRNRILIWDNPTTNGQAADMVLGQGNTTTKFTTGTAGNTSLKFRGITDIFVVPSPDPSGKGQDGKIIATDPDNYRVLIWSSFPTVSGAAATIALGQSSLTVRVDPGTSRFFTSGGLNLARFKTPSGVCVSPTDGRLYISDAAFHRVLVYTTVPTATLTPPSQVLFQASLSSAGTGGLSRSLCNAPRGVSVNAAGHLAVGDTDNRRVVIFYSTPITGSLPDTVVGQPDFDTSSLPARSETTISNPAGLTWQGGDMLVSDRNRIEIFKP